MAGNLVPERLGWGHAIGKSQDGLVDQYSVLFRFSFVGQLNGNCHGHVVLLMLAMEPITSDAKTSTALDARVVPLEAWHLNFVAEMAREADRIEFSFVTNRPMRALLEEMRLTSHRAFAGLVDGEPICVFGIVRPVVLSSVGHPWMITSRRVEQPVYRRAFLERSRETMAMTIKGYTHVWNIVHDENRLAIRWLKWLGFKMSEDTFDVGGGRFRRFEIKV